RRFPPLCPRDDRPAEAPPRAAAAELPARGRSEREAAAGHRLARPAASYPRLLRQQPDHRVRARRHADGPRAGPGFLRCLHRPRARGSFSRSGCTVAPGLAARGGYGPRIAPRYHRERRWTQGSHHLPVPAGAFLDADPDLRKLTGTGTAQFQRMPDFVVALADTAVTMKASQGLQSVPLLGPSCHDFTRWMIVLGRPSSGTRRAPPGRRTACWNSRRIERCCTLRARKACKPATA